jgi:hypothetical protein
MISLPALKAAAIRLSSISIPSEPASPQPFCCKAFCHHEKRSGEGWLRLKRAMVKYIYLYTKWLSSALKISGLVAAFIIFLMPIAAIGGSTLNFVHISTFLASHF